MPRSAHPLTPVAPAEVVLLGEALVDLFPEDLARPLSEADRFVRHLGGASANLAVGLCRQGVPTALVTLVGGDPFGRFLRNRLAEEGVVTDGIAQHPRARTGVTFVSLQDGEKTFLPYGQPSADTFLGPSDFTPAHIQRGRLLGLSSATLFSQQGQSATQQAVDLARRGGLLVSCDVNFRPHRWTDPREAPPLLRRLLGQCDIVKLTGDELSPLTGTDPIEAGAQRVRQMGPAVVVVTLGERGCYLDCAAGQAYLSADPVRVVDPTGAGDAFTAGLLATLLQDIGARSDGDQGQRLRALPLALIKQACARGNYLGSRACTAVGGTTAVPRAGG